LSNLNLRIIDRTNRRWQGKYLGSEWSTKLKEIVRSARI